MQSLYKIGKFEFSMKTSDFRLRCNAISCPVPTSRPHYDNIELSCTCVVYTVKYILGAFDFLKQKLIIQQWRLISIFSGVPIVYKLYNNII